jgi:MFS family permease
LVCIIASIGFAFDIYELLMLPLIVRPALLDLVGVSPNDTLAFSNRVSALFFIPAIAGGIFGLLGGYLTDILGRRRVLTGSILLYAISACAAGFSTSFEMLLVLRCTTFIGVCVEFVAAVAWLAELFPEPKKRESVLGLTQAFSSLGGLMVTGAYYLAVQYGDQLPAIHGGHAAWRYTLISGVIPAIPLIIIRPFLPESPAWAEKKRKGTLKRPSLLEIFAPDLLGTTIVTTLMFACCYGIAFGALQQTPRIVPKLPQVVQQMEGLPPPEAARVRETAVSHVNAYQEVGGLVGRFVMALVLVWLVSRRAVIRAFQIPALIVIPLVYFFPARDNLELLKWGMFLSGLLTVGQFSFWGNYLPRVYPLHLRGTGESFAANIGGRVFGTSFAWVTSSLVAPWMPDQSLALAAASVALFVCAAGLLLSFALPEPKTARIED